MIESWTRGVVRFRVIVVACWLAIVIVGAASAVRLPALLSISLAVPGTSSQQADDILVQHFAQNADGTFTVVFRLANPSPGAVRALSERFAEAARAVPTGHSTGLNVASGIVYGDVVTRLDLQRAATYTDTLRHAVSTAAFPTAYVTGEPAIQHDLTPVLAADLHKGELIALPVVLLALAATLGISLALAIPFLFAICTIAAALAIVYGLAHAVVMVSYIPNLVELIGLGLAVDYSLLVVHRFREELERNDTTVEDAIVRTMATAGRSVLFSGAAVTIGLSMILFIPVPFIRSVGIAGLLVPLLSMLATLTLQPALLSLLGRGGMRRLRRRRSVGDGAAGFWRRFANGVIRHRGAALAGAVMVLALAMAPVAALQLTPGSIFAIPQFTASARGESLLLHAVGAGALTPTDVVIDAGAPGRALTPAVSAATLRLADELTEQPEVFLVVIGSKPPYVDATGRYLRLSVSGRHEFGSEQSQRLVAALRDHLIPEARFPTGVQVYTGGAPSEGVDFLARAYGAFPWVVLAVLALTYVMLLRAFRSLLLPLIAVLLNVVSVAAAYGMLVVVFRFGLGADLLGLYRVSQIEGWIPVFLFAVLFGLSMDYQVFLVTRMRESWDSGADSDAAVSHGLERTGRVVSAAALVMVITFSGFVTGRVADLQEFGVGLALGVLLDATVVRFLLLPSLMAALGRWSWWLPAFSVRPAALASSSRADGTRREIT
ncbi:MAG: MMPL family transporter [Acidimicrobiales bacterium]|jgi:RND superfamily putative drug exporter